MIPEDGSSTGRRIRLWHLAAGALLFLGILLAIVYASVVFSRGIPPPAEGPHTATPRTERGITPVNAGPLAFTRDNGTEAVWQPVGSSRRDGVFILPWEGDGARLVVSLRVESSPPVRLAHDANLSATNTFAAAWFPNGSREAAISVKKGSYADLLTQELLDKRLSGRFHLLLDADGAALVLDGHFPKKDRRPPYEGILSMAFFAGAMLLTAVMGWRDRRARGSPEKRLRKE